MNTLHLSLKHSPLKSFLIIVLSFHSTMADKPGIYYSK